MRLDERHSKQLGGAASRGPAARPFRTIGASQYKPGARYRLEVEAVARARYALATASDQEQQRGARQPRSWCAPHTARYALSNTSRCAAGAPAQPECSTSAARGATEALSRFALGDPAALSDLEPVAVGVVGLRDVAPGEFEQFETNSTPRATSAPRTSSESRDAGNRRARARVRAAASPSAAGAPSVARQLPQPGGGARRPSAKNQYSRSELHSPPRANVSMNSPASVTSAPPSRRFAHHSTAALRPATTRVP
jgi:hypothetical protein